MEFEIIVVDNASGDGCGTMLRSEFPDVRFIAATRNLGFAQANNVGYLSSQGTTLLFLNPDTEVIDNAVTDMLDWLKEHPSFGALGPCLYNADGSVQQSCVQAFPTLINQFLDADLLRNWFPRWGIWGTWPLLNPEKESLHAEVDVISGACFMVRREVFEAVGRFTEEYFMYSDDVDLCYKIHHAGHNIACLTDCAVNHYGGESSVRRDASFAAVQRRKAMSQFFRRTRGPLCSGAYRATVGAAGFVRLCIACGALLFASSQEDKDSLRGVLVRWRSILLWAIGIEGNTTDLAGSKA